MDSNQTPLNPDPAAASSPGQVVAPGATVSPAATPPPGYASGIQDRPVAVAGSPAGVNPLHQPLNQPQKPSFMAKFKSKKCLCR